MFLSSEMHQFVNFGGRSKLAFLSLESSLYRPWSWYPTIQLSLLFHQWSASCIMPMHFGWCKHSLMRFALVVNLKIVNAKVSCQNCMHKMGEREWNVKKRLNNSTKVSFDEIWHNIWLVYIYEWWQRWESSLSMGRFHKFVQQYSSFDWTFYFTLDSLYFD